MPIVFLCIDPNTNGGNCPALFIDRESGDLLFQGDEETDAATRAATARHSPMGERETMVRIPARMRKLILEALSAAENGDLVR
ncbi:hypothetical protein LO762_30300 [Actinocorallia sp. API 0066]|uniref:hypothetical protein n=1 Tax=Actinocorallia sp. API 0066 TaxID=2896846 RepID=UPI001E31E293|nr:hypothetical protein [Actinocorallia sp. API 0066]MCD0453442.1 hypothetical protein [Actinocorallia sp. API 0066]